MPLNHASRGRLPALLFVAVAAFYFATAWVCGPASNWHGQTSEYYALLTDAFLAGQTSLLVPPPSELLALPNPYDPLRNGEFRLHDASLYHGKYYLYFGPTPALVLFLPYRVLTGSHLPSRIAVAIFCTGGFACTCALFFLLAKLEKWDIPAWFASSAVISLGTAPAFSFLLTHPSFYEVAIAAGYCFVMAGFLLTAHSLGQALALAFVGPVALCGVLLAAYNYTRFQNPFEFGVRYQLLADPKDLDNHFNHIIRNFLPGIYALVLSPPSRWLCWFYRSIGLFWGSPTALLGLFTPLVLRYGGSKGAVKLGSTRFTMYCIHASALSMLVVLALLGFTVGRYSVDFAPEFVLLSWCLLAAWWQAAPQLPKGRLIRFRFAVVAIALYSAVLGVGMCVQLVHPNVACG